MGHNEFIVQVANMLKARFPYIYINTWEEERVLNILEQLTQEVSLIKTTRQCVIWSITQGMRCEDKKLDATIKSPIKALEFIEKYQEPALFILKDFHIYFGGELNRPADFEVIRKLRDLLPILKRSGVVKNIIFLSPRLVLPYDLQKDMVVMDFELPNKDQMMTLLDNLIEANQKNPNLKIDLSLEDKEILAKAALGLTHQEAENAYARAMVTYQKLDKHTRDVIIDEKRQIIQKEGLLEFIKTKYIMKDVGGLDNLKKWLLKRQNAFLDSAKRYCLPDPKGILIAGVPGCGKSLIAKAVSEMWHIPLLRLDIGKIYSGVLGSSEENLRKSIKVAETMAPCILWIDEIEKGFGRASVTDGGTSVRILGTFLTWLQEKKSSVFVVATANEIDQLPTELLRKGRFDEIFFVDLPTFVERREIFKVHLEKRLIDEEVKGNLVINDELLNNLANRTEGFVGSEIENIVINGLFDAYYEKRSLTELDLVRAIKNMVPLSVTQEEHITAIREWAQTRAVAATSLDARKNYKEFMHDVKQEDGNRPKAEVISIRGGRPVEF